MDDPFPIPINVITKYPSHIRKKYVPIKQKPSYKEASDFKFIKPLYNDSNPPNVNVTKQEFQEFLRKGIYNQRINTIKRTPSDESNQQLQNIFQEQEKYFNSMYNNYKNNYEPPTKYQNSTINSINNIDEQILSKDISSNARFFISLLQKSHEDQMNAQPNTIINSMKNERKNSNDINSQSKPSINIVNNNNLAQSQTQPQSQSNSQKKDVNEINNSQRDQDTSIQDIPTNVISVNKSMQNFKQINKNINEQIITHSSNSNNQNNKNNKNDILYQSKDSPSLLNETTETIKLNTSLNTPLNNTFENILNHSNNENNTQVNHIIDSKINAQRPMTTSNCSRAQRSNHDEILYLKPMNTVEHMHERPTEDIKEIKPPNAKTIETKSEFVLQKIESNELIENKKDSLTNPNSSNLKLNPSLSESKLDTFDKINKKFDQESLDIEKINPKQNRFDNLFGSQLGSRLHRNNEDNKNIIPLLKTKTKTADLRERVDEENPAEEKTGRESIYSHHTSSRSSKLTSRNQSKQFSRYKRHSSKIKLQSQDQPQIQIRPYSSGVSMNHQKRNSSIKQANTDGERVSLSSRSSQRSTYRSSRIPSSRNSSNIIKREIQTHHDLILVVSQKSEQNSEIPTSQNKNHPKSYIKPNSANPINSNHLNHSNHINNVNNTNDPKDDSPPKNKKFKLSKSRSQTHLSGLSAQRRIILSSKGTLRTLQSNDPPITSSSVVKGIRYQKDDSTLNQPQNLNPKAKQQQKSSLSNPSLHPNAYPNPSTYTDPYPNPFDSNLYPSYTPYPSHTPNSLYPPYPPYPPNPSKTPNGSFSSYSRYSSAHHYQAQEEHYDTPYLPETYTLNIQSIVPSRRTSTQNFVHNIPSLPAISLDALHTMGTPNAYHPLNTANTRNTASHTLESASSYDQMSHLSHLSQLSPLSHHANGMNDFEHTPRNYSPYTNRSEESFEITSSRMLMEATLNPHSPHRSHNPHNPHSPHNPYNSLNSFNATHSYYSSRETKHPSQSNYHSHSYSYSNDVPLRYLYPKEEPYSPKHSLQKTNKLEHIEMNRLREYSIDMLGIVHSSGINNAANGMNSLEGVDTEPFKDIETINDTEIFQDIDLKEEANPMRTMKTMKTTKETKETRVTRARHLNLDPLHQGEETEEETEKYLGPLRSSNTKYSPNNNSSQKKLKKKSRKHLKDTPPLISAWKNL